MAFSNPLRPNVSSPQRLLMDTFDLPDRPIKGPVRVQRTPKAIVDAKPYERRETRCILAIGKKFLKGYDESYITSVGRDVNRGFSTTFTFVDGPLLTPEIRITHRFVQEDMNEEDNHVVHSRITVPINSIGKDVTYGPTVLRGHHALYLRLNTDLDKVIVSRTSETPIDVKLAADGESSVRGLREPKRIQLNILVSPNTAIIEELVNVIKSDFKSLKSREIVDFQLDCLLKGASWENLDFGSIEQDFPRPKYPIPATMVFHDERTRLIRLQASSFEEYHREYTKALPLGLVTHHCTLIPDPSSR